MRLQIVRLAVLLFTGATLLHAQPATPVIVYPTSGKDTNIRLNPTIFWSAYTRAGAGFERDIPRNFEIQIATDGTFAPATIVYTTDSGAGDPPVCESATRPKCLGAGMAHYVGADGAYPGLFQNQLAGSMALAEGTQYFVRMRVQSEQDGQWSSFSATRSFTTVRYDGQTFYVDAGGVNNSSCGAAGSPCRDLGYTLRNRVQDDRGDKVIINSGVHRIPCADSRPSCTTGPSSIDIDFEGNSFPRRVWIRGADPNNRPVLTQDRYHNKVVQWIYGTRVRDLIVQDVIFQGHESCCAVIRDPVNQYELRFDGRGVNNNQRVSFINVDFLRNASYNDTADRNQQGAEDFLWKNVRFQATPPIATNPLIGTATNHNFEAFTMDSCDFLTIKQLRSDSYKDWLTFANGFDATVGPTQVISNLLIEEFHGTRATNHPLRFAGDVENVTIRRGLWGFGQGATPGWNAAESSVHNLVVENNTLSVGILATNISGTTPGVGYLVIRNNIFSRPTLSGANSELLGIVDTSSAHVCKGRCVGGTRNGSPCGFCGVGAGKTQDCQSDAQCSAGQSCLVCPGGTCTDTCDVQDAATRISIDYNIYWVDGDQVGILKADGGGDDCTTNRNGFLGGTATCFSRRGSAISSNYDGWLALGYDANSPFQTYNGGANKEPVQPLLVFQPQNDGTQGPDDLRQLEGSPSVDAGDPRTYLPVGAQAPVDIGGSELVVAPVISSVSATDCVAGGTPTLTFNIQDPQVGEQVNPFSISVQVLADQVPVTANFSTSGSGNPIALTVQVLQAVPAGAVLTVTVSASDNASPAHVSTEVFTFRTSPPAPTGVTLS